MSAAAGDWLHVYRALFDHPKSKRLAKRLGMDVPAAVGYLICLWTWSMAIAPDGDLSRFDPEDIEAAAGWGGEDGLFVQAATECRWFDSAKRGLLIHDWNDWAGVLVLKRARERERSAERRAADQADAVHAGERDTRPAVDHRATSGRPAVETVERPNDQRPTVGREKREKREREEKEHSRNSAEPVDNFAAEPEEHRRSANKSAKAKSPPTCDGQPCKVRELRCDIRRDVALIAGEVDAATLYGNHSDLSKTMHRYAARICEYCQEQFGEVERPERDEKCQAVMKASVDRILAVHHKTPINNLPAYLNGELKRLTHIGDLCGDDLVTELRSRRRNGTNEAGRVGDFLPDVRAGTQPQEVAKACNPGEAVPA